jgi:hypothetical protein
MSRRESGSDTWPRSTAFAGDNLDLANAAEEDDVDHGSESPSWLSGASAVGTGAGPPADQETEADREEHPYPADVGIDRGAAAPGFNDAAPAEFGNAHGSGPEFVEDGFAEGPGFTEDPADERGSPAVAGPAGFGEAPAVAGYAATPATDEFAAEGAGGFGARADNAQSFGNQTYEGQGFEHAGPGNGQQVGYAGPGNGQQGEYGGGYQGEYPGAYQNGGLGAAQAGSPLGGAPEYGPPAVDYSRRDNGTATREQPPYPRQHPPTEPPRPRFSVRGLRRNKRARAGRQAQLTIARFEPWSVMKFSFVISLVAFIVLFVAVAVLYAVLSGLGVFSALQRTIESITSSQSSSGFNLSTYLSASRVLGYTGLLGAINVVLITAISTVGSVLYNITADLAGGVEVTLKETDGS